jgi:hypothetical protein
MKGKTRRSVVVLAVVAMIAALLALPITPAAAATDACPASTPSAGFTDLGGLSASAVDAVNCVAFYGITSGTSATTYGPNIQLPRWQMALFLVASADAMGVTLPDGSDQGFADIAALSASAEKAINQIKQLGITSGTSATTFSPNALVTRWQMAIFLTKLLDKAGYALGDGSDQGFTDISSLSETAEIAINQAKQAGITAGVTATTFDPMGVVTRWQMALFLAATLDADGVQPPATLGAVTVTPATEADLSANAARAYVASFRNSNGSVYSGYVGVELLDMTSTGAAHYGTDATNVTFESVDGVATAGTEWNGFAGTDGSVTFVVRNAGGAGDVVPLAWIDLNGDNAYGSDQTVAPTEQYALGGAAVFSGAPATEAASGTYTGLVVSSVDTGSFEASEAATNCGNGVGALCSFYYDSNDIFLIEDALSDMTAFGTALSETDVVDVTAYVNNSTSAVVTYNITTDNTATSTLKVTVPSAATSIDSNNYTIKGTGEVGAAIRIYADTDNNGAADEAVLGTDTVAADGSWSVTVPLQQDAANNFVAWQKVGTATPTLADVPTITEGAPAAATILSSTGANGGTAGVLDVGDTIVIVFSEAIAGVSSGDTVSLIDSDGSTAVLTVGSDVSSAVSTTTVTNDTLTLTVTNLLFATGGSTPGQINTTAQIQAISGFQGADGLAINVTGSGAGRVFTSF